MSCGLSEAQKLDIIASLGLGCLTQVLHECYINKGVASHPSYNAKQDAEFSFLQLRKRAGEIDRQEYLRLLREIIMPTRLPSSQED